MPAPRPSAPSARALRRRAARWALAPVLLLLATVATGCVSTGVNPVTGNTRAYGYSWDEEVELGRTADKQIQNQYGVYEDEALQQYVDEVAQKVLAESHMRRPSTPQRFRETEFEFRVLDSPIINAFALPGGYVYVTRGLVAHLNNEAQLAVVLGHEIAHVEARHASQQAARRQFTQGLLVGGAVLGQAALGGNVGRQVLNLGGTAAQLLSLRYSRDNERESDRLGVEYAAKAGYDAAEGAAFFESLERKQEQSGPSIPTWQSTHPDPGARQQTIPQLAQKWAARTERPGTLVNQRSYYEALGGIVVGPNPRQGFTEDDMFYHPDLAFQFSTPAGWAVQNQPRRVVLIEPNEEAYLLFRIADADTPAAAARTFAEESGGTVQERRATTVQGKSAERIRVEVTTSQGQTVQRLAYFIAYEGRVYAFEGLTLAARYDTYRRAFESTMTSFARLTDADALNVQPTRLAIRPADREAPFRAFIDRSALPNDLTPSDLAILNQLRLDEPVRPSRMLKLPD